jgi:hypothetical protein
MTRLGSFLWIALLVGCAGQPPAPRPMAAAQPPTAPPAAAPQPAVPAAETHKVKVDASNVEAVQRAGYRLVNKGGEPLFCRTDPITGSRLQTRTTCLTEQELYDQMSTMKQTMDRMGTSKMVGPSGH